MLSKIVRVLELFLTHLTFNLESPSLSGHLFSAFVQVNGAKMTEHIASCGISFVAVGTLNRLVGIRFVAFHVMPE